MNNTPNIQAEFDSETKKSTYYESTYRQKHLY